MPQKIDELQLQIGSDASDAIRQLGNLAGALDIAASAARRLSSTSGFLSSFGSSLERIARTDLTKAISNLETLSRLDLKNLKDKKVTIDIVVNGTSEVERMKYATQDATKDMLRNAEKMASALGQKYNVDTDGIKELTDQYKELIKAVAAKDYATASTTIDSMWSTIAEHGKMSLAELQGVKQQFQKEYDELKGIVVGTNGLAGTDVERLAGMGFLGNLKKGETGIDSNWGEIIDEHRESLTNLGSTAETVGDQAEALAERLSYLRKMLEPKAITNGDLLDSIGESVSQQLDAVNAGLDAATDKHMQKSFGKIPLDLEVNQAGFERQIQKAINEATSPKKKYTSKPITIELDTEQLKRNIEHTLSLVDFGKLPQTAKAFTDMSSALSTMNQVDLKNTGINKFVNALIRLVKVDTSKFDVGVLNSIATAVKNIAKVGDVPKTLTGLVSSLARLANVGDKAKLSADGIKVLGSVLKDTIKKIKKLGEIDSSLNQFIAALASLASAGDKTGITAQNLGTLTTAVVNFLNAMQSAPAISDNLAMTIQGLGNLAAAGQKVGKALDTATGNGGNKWVGRTWTALSNAAKSIANDLKKVLSVSLSLGAKGASALGSFMQKLGLLPGHANGVDRAALSFGNLLRTLLPFVGIRGIFNWAKEAVTAGSSIVELENVIDTSFGSIKKGYEDISGYIYDWAKTTIDTFGVSEIAAEQYAGRLMAMFNSSGFDVTEGMRDSAAKMSTDLIERAGDIASFYDIGVDEAMTKIQAGLAGMNRPLRSLGVNMTVANLESYALSQGITTAWKSMDQATQMALRYNYILDATKYTMGDFQRTSGTFANQIRLLSLNFQMLSATIGQGLISAIAPVITWLNLLIRRLIQAATAFRTFMWTLFGKAIGAQRGVVNEMAGYLDDSASATDDLGSSAGGAADGLGSAGKAAKNLKKQLTVLPFDELNQLAKDTDSASSGSGGGAGGGGVGGVGGLEDLGLLPDLNYDLDGSDEVDAISKWAKKIRDAFKKQKWAHLGKIIADGINDGFKFIYDVLDWNKIKPKIVDGFIVPFQTSFNSMMEWIDWPLIGRTFARGLNDIVYTLRAWITGFQWKKYGMDLAEGMNSLVNGVDADALGRLIADKFKMAWDFFGGWVKKFNFKSLGSKLRIGFTSLIDELDPKDMGESLADFLNGIADLIIEFFRDGEVRDKVVEAFVEFANGFLKKLDKDKIKESIGTIKDNIVGALKDAIGGINKEDFAETLGTVLSEIPWDIVGSLMAAKAAGSLALSLFGQVFKDKAKEEIAKIFTGSVASGSGTASGVAGAVAGATGLSIGTIVGTTLAIGAITIGGIALGQWIKKKGLGQLNTAENKQNAAKVTAEGQTKNQQALNKAGINGAGYSTQIQTASNSGSSGSKTTNVVSTVYKGIVDSSMGKATEVVNELKSDPTITKLLKGQTDSSLINSKDVYESVKDAIATKFIYGRTDGSYTFTKKDYNSVKNDKATKTTYGIKTAGFKTTYIDYFKVKNDKATKTAYGVPTRGFNSLLENYPKIESKDVKVTVDVKTTVKEIYAKTLDSWGKWTSTLVGKIATIGNAKGGLFNSAAAFQVFGEAGAEAAIPLERKSTMKRIANAIVDSGGMGTSNSDEIANAIAVRILPAIASMMVSQNERPVNVNATLYTENNEVLARAVNKGNRSLDKRYHPVAQYSY